MELSAESFARLGRMFAASVRTRVSWAWSESRPSPFSPRPGYLHSSPLLLPTEKCARTESAPEESERGGSDDDCSLAGGCSGDRLELHIVHSPTYKVPTLLLLGYSADGQLWGREQVCTYLSSRASWLGGMDAHAVTQMEHPVLGLPFFSLHPCRTAEWMSALLNKDEGGPDVSQLDYLSAWWSVVAPIVGDELTARDALAVARVDVNPSALNRIT
ncbi:MAG: hypothetical protein SGPRY_012978 [Prymnesium sp.]